MTAYQKGFLVGVLVVIFLVIFAIKVSIKGRGGEKEEYDERQLLARGNAYKNGFFAFMIELAVLCLARGLDIKVEAYVDDLALAFLLIVIPLTVFAFSAVMHDAFFAFNMTTRRAYTLYIMIFVVNLVSGIVGMRHEKIVENGVLTGGGGFANLSLAFIFGVVLLAQYIKLKNQKEED